jgi:putative oxidoreductase
MVCTGCSRSVQAAAVKTSKEGLCQRHSEKSCTTRKPLLRYVVRSMSFTGRLFVVQDRAENGRGWYRLIRTSAPQATVLIRLMVGAVFLSEGIQKFLFPAQLGTGRFVKIGLPIPDLLAPFVGGFEIVCGTLVLPGLLTRLAVVPLVVIMAVALTTTKWPMLSAQGFWHMAHESRTDWSMLLGSLFLLVSGSGPWSLDARLTRRSPVDSAARSKISHH